MAGGTWVTQNKVLPGVYTNFIGVGPKPSVIADRGVVALPVTLPWLPEKEVLALYPKDVAQFTADYGALAVPVREVMKNAKQLYFYRLNKGTRAKATIHQLVCTAKYSGSFGNRFEVSVENALGESGKFHVITWFDTDELERQTVSSVKELVDNDWIVFSQLAEDSTLEINAGVPLTGGDNGTVTVADYAKFFSAIETYTFNAIACPSTEMEIKALFVAFVKRMVNDEGKYMQGVIPDILTADFEGLISVKNGVHLEGGEHIPLTTAAAYIAGATASVSLGASLTHANYEGAVDVDVRYTEPEQKVLATTGQLAFIPSPTKSNRVVVQKDINTLVTFDDKKTYAMSKNKIIRIAYDLAININNIGLNFFIGKVPNDEEGRSLLHAAVLEYFRELEKQRALRDVLPEDIVVSPGRLIDAVVVDYKAKVVDVMEIIYNTIYIYG